MIRDNLSEFIAILVMLMGLQGYWFAVVYLMVAS
jgi:hypothetical protein